MNIAYSGFSDIGKVAPIMEDFIYDFKLHNINFFCVADGMGGVKEGNVAGNLIMYELEKYLKTLPLFTLNELPHIMKTAHYIVNSQVIAYKAANPNMYHNFCAAYTIIAVDKMMNCLVFHIGDTRALLVRSGNVYQLTTDDTVAQKLFEEGKIKEDELLQHPQRHILTKYCGDDKYEISCIPGNFMIGDVFVLMTNGIYDVLSNNDLLELFRQDLSIDEMVKDVIKVVNEHSGYDNSAIIVGLITE